MYRGHLSLTFRHFVACGIVLLLMPQLTGCTPGRNSAPVSGKVTLNGEPQEGIFIYFEPELPKDIDPQIGLSKSYGKTDTEGRFELNFMDADKDRSGALVGKHVVTADDERTFEDRGKKSRVRRGWKVSFEVPQSGTTDAEFELTSK